MFEYDTAAKAAAEKLDKYDFTEILKYCYGHELRSPWDIYDVIVEEYAELDVMDSPLDELSEHELMDYLSERYNVVFEEVVTYRMWYK